MRTPLLPLQELIDCLQNPPSTEDPASAEKVIAMHKKATQAMDEITNLLDECIEKGVSSDIMRNYVSTCQEKLTQLCNSLPKDWLEEVPATYVKIDLENPVHLCNDICHHLEDLILYLMIMHARYYNKMAITPNLYRELMRQRLEPGFAVIRKWFHEAESCCEDLQSLVLDLFDTFDPLIENHMNHYQLDFLRQLQQALLKLYRKEGNSLEQPQLRNLLISFNLNNTAFYEYCTSYITQQLGELPNVHAQLDLLSYTASEIQQVTQQRGLIYDKNAPNIKELMHEWIQVETKHLRTKEKPKNTGKTTSSFDTLPDNFKLQTSLTVAEIAALIRILKEMDVVENRNMQDVFRMIPFCFCAEKKTAFESSVFQTSYHHISDETFEKITSLATQIIKQVHQLRKDDNS